MTTSRERLTSSSLKRAPTSFGWWILQRPLTQRRLYGRFVNFLEVSIPYTLTHIHTYVHNGSITKSVYARTSSVSFVSYCISGPVVRKGSNGTFFLPCMLVKIICLCPAGTALSRCLVETCMIIYETQFLFGLMMEWIMCARLTSLSRFIFIASHCQTSFAITRSVLYIWQVHCVYLLLFDIYINQIFFSRMFHRCYYIWFCAHVQRKLN